MYWLWFEASHAACIIKVTSLHMYGPLLPSMLNTAHCMVCLQGPLEALLQGSAKQSGPNDSQVGVSVCAAAAMFRAHIWKDTFRP